MKKERSFFYRFAALSFICTILFIAVSATAAMYLQEPVVSMNKKDIKPNTFKVGEKLSDFTGKDANGKKIDSKDYLDKVVVMNFWFVHCKPCIQEMPMLNAVKRSFKDKNVAFLAVTYDDAELVKELFRKTRFDFDQLVDANAFMQLYKVTMFPVTIVTDRKGIIRYIRNGSFDNNDEIVSAIQKCLSYK